MYLYFEGGNYYVEVWDQEEKKFLLTDVDADKDSAIQTAQKIVESQTELAVEDCSCCNVTRVIHLTSLLEPNQIEAVCGDFYA